MRKMVALAFFATLFATCVCAQVDTTEIKHSVVILKRHFQPTAGNPDVIGYSAMAWFLKKDVLVNIGHFIETPPAVGKGWQEMLMVMNGKLDTISVRIKKIIKAPDDVVFLKLKKRVHDAQVLSVKNELPVKDEPVFICAYADGNISFAEGKWYQMSDSTFHPNTVGFGLLETWSPSVRMAVDLGTSGSPVLDGHGQVVGIISEVICQTINFMGIEQRVSTPWGEPNNAAVMLATLPKKF